jgi:hypothetical protein
VRCHGRAQDAGRAARLPHTSELALESQVSQRGRRASLGRACAAGPGLWASLVCWHRSDRRRFLGAGAGSTAGGAGRGATPKAPLTRSPRPGQWGAGEMARLEADLSASLGLDGRPGLTRRAGLGGRLRWQSPAGVPPGYAPNGAFGVARGTPKAPLGVLAGLRVLGAGGMACAWIGSVVGWLGL